jgi:hypothetical protein
MANERGRELRAVGAALLSHVAFLAFALRHAPQVLTLEPAPKESPAATLDLEPLAPVSPSTSPKAPGEADRAKNPSPKAPGEADRAKNPSPKAPGEADRAKNPSPKAPGEPSTAEKPSAGPSKTPPDEYGGPPDPGVGVTSLPPGLGTPLWTLPGAIPSGAPAAPAPTTLAPRPVDTAVAGKVLNGSLRSRDKTLGLQVPAAGAIATSVADAVRSGGPLDARASFEVSLSADGHVNGVRLLKASGGDAAGWERVVASAKGALQKRGLEMGGEGRPVTVIVKVESSVEYPAGSKVAMVAKPVCANEVFEQVQKLIDDAVHGGGGSGLVRGLRDDAGHFIPYSAMDDEQRRKFCIPIGIVVHGDLSNVGAHTSNVVRSSFEVVREGEKALQPEAVAPLDTRLWGPRDMTKAQPPPKAKKKRKRQAEW